MIRVDNRTEEQKLTHTWLVVGTDQVLSNWGQSSGGLSSAAWACRPDCLEECLEWVEGRGDMRRIRVVVDRKGDRYAARGAAHLHIYVFEPKSR